MGCITVINCSCRLFLAKIPPFEEVLQFTTADWAQFGCFISNLQWQKGAELRISYNELAVLFALRKFKCECLNDELCTYAQLTGWLKNAFAVCRRHVDVTLFPGEHAGHVAHGASPCHLVQSAVAVHGFPMMSCIFWLPSPSVLLVLQCRNGASLSEIRWCDFVLFVQRTFSYAMQWKAAGCA